jgi:hypothetical protein
LDLFHVGFVARDIRASMEELSDVLGCAWSDVSEGTMDLRHGDAVIHPEMRFAFSLGSDPGPDRADRERSRRVWELPEGVDLQFNHLGYWTESFDKDSAGLGRRGQPDFDAWFSGADFSTPDA